MSIFWRYVVAARGEITGDSPRRGCDPTRCAVAPADAAIILDFAAAANTVTAIGFGAAADTVAAAGTG